MQYLWDFDDGTFSNHKDTAHVFENAGTYHVCLRVDSVGIKELWNDFMYDIACIDVEVIEPETPLTANADGENLGGYETIINEPVQLFGDAFGGIPPYTWHWDFGDGSSISEQNPTHTYREVGTYTVTLMVFDSEYTTAFDTAEVTVYDREALLASIKASSYGFAGVDMFFESSVLGGKPPYKYSWDFGDGTISNEEDLFHVFENPGTYTVTLTVTDTEEATATDTHTVNIEEQTEPEYVEILDVKGGFGVQATIKSGDQSVDWTIQVDGFVLIGGQAEGTFDAHMENTVKLPLTLAFGRTDITVTANHLQETYTSFALGPIFMSLQET
jgi:PKD repeat protein